MSVQSEAAEQAVRMGLEGTEAAVKIAGAGAKQAAVLLAAALRGQKRTRGRARIESMLKSGRELKVFAVRDPELKVFCREAKRYGILYTVLKDRDARDGCTDILIPAEDAGKAGRIFDRFHLSTVRETEKKDRDEKGPVLTKEEKEKAFFDEAFGSGEEKAENPRTGRTAERDLSGPFSGRKANGEREGSEAADRPSVRDALRAAAKAPRGRNGKNKTRKKERAL